MKRGKYDALFIILLLATTFLSMEAIYLTSFRMTYEFHDDGHITGLVGGLLVIIGILIVAMWRINPFHKNAKDSDSINLM